MGVAVLNVKGVQAFSCSKSLTSILKEDFEATKKYSRLANFGQDFVSIVAEKKQQYRQNQVPNFYRPRVFTRGYYC